MISKYFWIEFCFLIYLAQMVFSVDLTTTESGMFNVTEDDSNSTLVPFYITTTTEKSVPRPFCFTPKQDKAKILAWGKCLECSCDVTEAICDVNCCCDPACSQEDEKTFSICQNYAPILSKSLCFHTDMFYSINSFYNIVKTENNLYCVIDSRIIDVCYHPWKRIQNIESLLLFERPINHNSPVFDPNFKWYQEDWKVGRPILAATTINSIYFLIGLPDGVCSGAEGPFLYLIDTNAVCNHYIGAKDACETNKYLHPATYYDDMEIIQNATRRFPIDAYLCKERFENCTKANDELEMPEFDELTEICENVVTSVKYTFLHRGIQGVVRVEVKLVIGNLTNGNSGESGSNVHQTLQVIFKRENETDKNQQPRIKRSGNPGYLIGYPVLTRLFSADNITKFNVSNINHLYFPPLQNPNLCSSQLVRFGENLRFSCNIIAFGKDVGSSCNGLKNSTLNLRDLAVDRIGCFGNSAFNKNSDWVTIRHVMRPSSSILPVELHNTYCSDVSLNYHLVLSYAMSGHHSIPQSKIVGAHYLYTNSTYSFLCRRRSKCTSYNVPVMFMVTFVNVTKS